LTQIRTFWDGLDARKRLVAGLSVLAILAAVFGIGRVATQPSMTLLYSGLDAAAAGEVVAQLEADGVPYEIRGAAIYVDGARRDAVRMALAAEGLPAGGPAGYELLDALSGFGTTSQMFDAAYWRAKEGELARTITGSANVRSARVYIANPVSQPFARAPEGSASVTVTMARGELDLAQASAIRYLVSSAVAGLAPEAVAVIDSARGVVLAGDDASPVRAALEKPAEREEALRASIQRLLEARVGAGRAMVEVSVETDLEAQTITERVIDPESRVAISSDVEESQESQQGSAPGVTVASNLPDGNVQGGANESSRSATQSRSRQNFEVSETRRERVIQPGQVRKVSVAAMVDGVVEPNAAGEPVWQPRSEQEMATLRQLVQSAIGYDAARGDSVTISSLQFTAPPEAGVLAESAGASFLAANGARLAQVGVLGAIVLALILFVLRPMLSRQAPVAPAELAGPQEPAPVGLPQLGAPAPAGEAPLQIANQSQTKIDRLREVLNNRGEDSAAVLRGWIETSENGKEPARA
jgi:flagellar M-ring protein FliF